MLKHLNQSRCHGGVLGVGVGTEMGLRNHVLRGGLYPPRKGPFGGCCNVAFCQNLLTAY